MILPGGTLSWRVHLDPVEGRPGIDPQKIRDSVIIKFRKGGERFSKQSQGPQYRLKTWLQENGIPYWLRGVIPLIYDGDDLIQIGQQLVRRDYAARLDSQAILDLNYQWDRFKTG